MADLFGTGPQTSTTTSNLGFATPYYDRLANAAESQAQTPYTPYGGQRVAKTSPLETQAYQQSSQMGTPAAFGQANNLFSQVGSQGLGMSQFMPGSTTSGYTAPDANEYNAFSGYQSGGIQSLYNPSQFSQQDFGMQQAQQYMNPYQQNVTDIQAREANRQFAQQQNALRTSAAQKGAFGGSRGTLLETEGQRNQNQLLNDIQEKGLSAAFQNAQQQFNTDRQRRLAVEQAQEQAYQSAGQMGLTAQQANEAARLAGSQFGLQGLNAREQANQFQAQNALSTFQANEQARQQAANIMLQGQGQALGAAQGLAGLGSSQNAADISRLNQLNQFGGQMRDLQQRGLDVDYQNFTEQRDYGKNQLGFLGSILKGIPAAQDVTKTDPGANLLGQLANLGIGGYSLYQLLNGISPTATPTK